MRRFGYMPWYGWLAIALIAISGVVQIYEIAHGRGPCFVMAGRIMLPVNSPGCHK